MPPIQLGWLWAFQWGVLLSVFLVIWLALTEILVIKLGLSDLVITSALLFWLVPLSLQYQLTEKGIQIRRLSGKIFIPLSQVILRMVMESLRLRGRKIKSIKKFGKISVFVGLVIHLLLNDKLQGFMCLLSEAVLVQIMMARKEPSPCTLMT